MGLVVAGYLNDLRAWDNRYAEGGHQFHPMRFRDLETRLASDLRGEDEMRADAYLDNLMVDHDRKQPVPVPAGEAPSPLVAEAGKDIPF